MLGQHPQLYATAELECFTADTLAGCLSFGERVPVVTTHGLLRSLAQLLCGEQTNASINIAHAWLADRQQWSGAQLIRRIEAAISPQRLLEKSPIHALRWESLQRLAVVTDKEPMIHLARHPVTAVQSLTNAYARNGQSLSARDALRAWLHGHQNILRWIEQQHPSSRALLVQSEAFLAEPEGQLRRVCKHLGVSDASDCIEPMLHPELSPYAGIGPSFATTGNDPHWLESPALRRSQGNGSDLKLGQLWNLEGVEPELVLKAMALGEQLGYR